MFLFDTMSDFNSQGLGPKTRWNFGHRPYVTFCYGIYLSRTPGSDRRWASRGSGIVYIYIYIHMFSLPLSLSIYIYIYIYMYTCICIHRSLSLYIHRSISLSFSLILIINMIIDNLVISIIWAFSAAPVPRHAHYLSAYTYV